MVELARRGTVTGVELASQSLEVARERGVGTVLPGSLDDPLALDDDAFDLAVALDVLEHVRDDDAALRELARVIAPGGRLLVTVPQYGWLWGEHDVLAHHHRRYTRSLLLERAAAAGLQAERVTSFNTMLLPAIAAARARPARATAQRARVGSRPHAAGRRERRARARHPRRGRADPSRPRPAGGRVAARRAAARSRRRSAACGAPTLEHAHLDVRRPSGRRQREEVAQRRGMAAERAVQTDRQLHGAPAEGDRGVAARTRQRPLAEQPRARGATILVRARSRGHRLRTCGIGAVHSALKRHPSESRVQRALRGPVREASPTAYTSWRTQPAQSFTPGRRPRRMRQVPSTP